MFLRTKEKRYALHLPTSDGVLIVDQTPDRRYGVASVLPYEPDKKYIEARKRDHRRDILVQAWDEGYFVYDIVHRLSPDPVYGDLTRLHTEAFAKEREQDRGPNAGR